MRTYLGYFAFIALTACSSAYRACRSCVDDYLSATQSKGAQGPDEWLSPFESFWPEYALKWRAIKQTYGLTTIWTEEEALRAMESLK